MKQKQTNMHALREYAESGEDKVGFVCWWYGQTYDVSSWWTSEEQQKRRDEHSQDEGRDKAEKIKSIDRNDVVGFRWIWICAWCFEVICCVWYRKIHRDISWHHVPHHAISQDTVCRDIVPGVSYIYPEFVGLIWRYRIPSIYFSIRNLVHYESKRNGYLAIELQKQWYLLGSVPHKKIQVIICG